MNPTKKRRRKNADAPGTDSVKTSIVVGRDLHCRWQAAASLRGIPANALAVEALMAAVKWVVIHDKRKTTDRVEVDDRPGQGSELSSDGEVEAA